MAKKKNRKQYKQKVTTDKRVDMRTGGRVKAQVGGRTNMLANSPRGVQLIDEEAVQRGPGTLPTAT